MWVIGINAVAGIAAAMVWLAYVALATRERRWGWVTLFSVMTVVAAVGGLVYFAALFVTDVAIHLDDKVHLYMPLAVGLPAMFGFGLLREMKVATEEAVEQAIDTAKGVAEERVEGGGEDDPDDA